MAKRFALCSICFEVISNSDCAELQTRSSTENRFMQKPNHVGLATCCSSLKSGNFCYCYWHIYIRMNANMYTLAGTSNIHEYKRGFSLAWGEHTVFFTIIPSWETGQMCLQPSSFPKIIFPWKCTGCNCWKCMCVGVVCQNTFLHGDDSFYNCMF